MDNMTWLLRKWDDMDVNVTNLPEPSFELDIDSLIGEELKPHGPTHFPKEK